MKLIVRYLEREASGLGATSTVSMSTVLTNHHTHGKTDVPKCIVQCVRERDMEIPCQYELESRGGKKNEDGVGRKGRWNIEESIQQVKASLETVEQFADSGFRFQSSSSFDS